MLAAAGWPRRSRRCARRSRTCRSRSSATRSTRCVRRSTPAPTCAARQHDRRPSWRGRRPHAARPAPGSRRSGGLTLARRASVAETGVDYLAVGALTHSAPVLDIGARPAQGDADRCCSRSTSATPTPCSGVFDGERAGRLLADQDRRPSHRRRAGADLPRACSATREIDRRSRSARPCRRCCTRCARCPSATTRDVPAGHRRARHQHRRTAALRQPEGGRRRPHRQRARRIPPYGGPAIVVDFGTSTNFDVVSREGRVPRRRARPRHRDLHRRAGRPRRAAVQGRAGAAALGIGKTTVEALQSGILFGFAGQVDGLVRRIVAELGPGTAVVATGGLAPLVIAESETIEHYEPDLTLIGLRLVFDRNT